MTDDHDFTPTGVKRTAAAHARAREDDLRKQLAAMRERAERAEGEALALAAFINDRVGSRAWGHADVMHLVSVGIVDATAAVLSKLEKAKAEGLAPSYAVTREVILRRFDATRQTLLAWAGQPGEHGEAAQPGLITDTMKEDLNGTLRLPKASTDER